MERLRVFLMERDLPRRAWACYQCGACAGGCPAGKWPWGLNPRQLIEKILRDEVQDIVQDEKLWLCSMCLTCLERCPQKIEVSEIIVQLKNAAARLGYAPESEIKKSQAIMHSGWLQQPGKRVLRIRQELGLPPLPQGIDVSGLQDLAAGLDWQEKTAAIKTRKNKRPEGSKARRRPNDKEETAE